MKKSLILSVIVALSFTACSSLDVAYNAKSQDLGARLIESVTISDFDITENKISYEVKTTTRKEYKKAKKSRLIQNKMKVEAMALALESVGADVMVEPRFVLTSNRKTREFVVKVTGYPATYKNFRTTTVDDERLIKINYLENHAETVKKVQIIK